MSNTMVKEAYRRWVCSTLIPYFAEPEDIRQKTTTSNTINKTENHSAASSNLYHARTSRSTRNISDTDNDNANDNNNDNSKKILTTTTTSYNNRKHVQRRRTNSGTSSDNVSQSISTAIANPIVKDPLLDRLLKRTKRKSQVKRRRRLRPCLSVCQTVEQICPYLLPADRAPAYPTQYAGEPTFLCLDHNILETGEQLRKSNNGPPNCCYRYCDTPADGICAHCDLFYSNQSNRTGNTTASQHTSTSPSESSSALRQHPENLDLSRLVEIDNIYYYDDYDDAPSEPAANCQTVQSTTPTSSHPCTIPYYASSSIKLGSTLMSYRFFIFWTIFWCLLVNISIPINYEYCNWTNYKKLNVLLYQQQQHEYEIDENTQQKQQLLQHAATTMRVSHIVMRL
ncbi:unnamed protein product [Hermetia illucens]|uniref:Uncharacterized protein n=1 Tax=Hermetia illucens TaxID=343691 RepID=A0A7R8UC50_HERIL|nr:unnamed protein product [Hermetia illucens]